MARTTQKGQQILDFIRDFTAENGFAPSIREIGNAVGLQSTASVSYHLRQLQAKHLQTPVERRLL